jgi:tRNA(fMet)-specific endonuclease VapC
VRYLLDTDTCVALMNRSSPRVAERLLAQHPESVGMSIVTAAELRFGAEKSQRREAALAALDLLLAGVKPVPFDLPAIESYGHIRATLSRKGTPIGPLDTLIAAQAVSLGVVLVTGNLREFRRVPKLEVESWLPR